MTLDRMATRVLVAGVLALSAAAAASAEAVRVGEERVYQAASPAEYPAGDVDRSVVWSETIASPGATFLRVHFDRFNLPDGDFVSVSSPDGSDYWTYSARGLNGTGEFWSFVVEAETVVVALHAGPNEGRKDAARYGIQVDRIAHGFAGLGGDAPEPDPTVVCGTDGREDAVCHSDVNQRPVARLSFQSGGSSFVCTGWLVRGGSANTMLTNNHCVDNQTEVSTVQARFNYQRTSCGGSTNAATTSYAGGTFLRTHSGLDYTIFTLQGSPEATWGEYVPTSKQPTVGLAINFPQHPGGGLKRIGFWANSGHTTRCTASVVNATYGGATSGSQMAYGCDSAGGSSGSPIMDAGTGRIIGLHHFGGVTSSPCRNAATQMRQVCSNAGSLLTCATN